jgi:hypothetical protein
MNQVSYPLGEALRKNRIKAEDAINLSLLQGGNHQWIFCYYKDLSGLVYVPSAECRFPLRHEGGEGDVI